MSHSYISCTLHCIWSTKDRRNLLTLEIQDRLWPYIGGVARENGVKAMCVGGTENHVHMLVSLPSTMPVAKAIQIVKGGTSKWMNETFGPFEWQEGYGAFAVGSSLIPTTISYIQNQRQHHKTRTFEEEFLEILCRCGVEFDPRYVFG